mgnify:CR=1 FL=1
MEKIKLAVIFGGQSTEHDVSIVSGTSVIKNLNKEEYDILPIYISEEGDWFLYKKEVKDIEVLTVGEKINELEKIENPINILKDTNVVFPVLHGLYGEDGTVQGLLELLNKKYVGCKVLASSVCMDKVYAKATEFGGMISGEHGIGHGKMDYLAESLGPVQMRIMEGVKEVFDPNMILNPGKICYKL